MRAIHLLLPRVLGRALHPTRDLFPLRSCSDFYYLPLPLKKSSRTSFHSKKRLFSNSVPLRRRLLTFDQNPFFRLDPMEAGARDLLRRFSGGFSTEEVTGGDSDEIELGLSLGGCFSSQDAENNRLMRSSSIPAILRSDFPAVVPLVRTCSMPSDAEEEIRRRKEVQSIKRMEAMRKRVDKRNLKRFDEDFEGGSVAKMRRFEVEENGVQSSSRRFGVASQGSSSSGGSEFDSQQEQGFEFAGIISASDVNNPSKSLTTSKQNNHKPSSVPPLATPTPTPKSINGAFCCNGTELKENVLRKNGEERSLSRGISDLSKNMVEEMPSVSTRGNGPNGRRIDGFLYSYGKGEVSIVCVCHGNFLSPAEFVKHAGGGDVAHPLRHIVVNPSSGSLL
ncbi:hypothetical protein M5K25_004450 [Dendrobium thyrsiflorum]|uniref:Ninja-family protein n=1 Tax=Dendrobium thyrsiflorum TaxID=117978 RepID=A0ABD0VTN6_DENTH